MQLIQEFNKYFSSSLIAEFDLMRYRENPIPFILGFILKENSTNSVKEDLLYNQFCDELLNGAWKDFIIRRPVFARLVITIIKTWSQNISEFLNRLVLDLDEINIKFNKGEQAGKISNLETFLSDRHNGGRTVMRATFESGLQLIYKPRSLKIDKAWETFLSNLKIKGIDIGVHTPVLIDKGDYGWVEAIDNISLKDPKDAQTFYFRSGMLLCLAYILGSNDLHEENVIAYGANPAIIDLETIIKAEVKPFDYDEGKNHIIINDISYRFWTKSVINTMLLPVWLPVNQQLLRDYGGLTPSDNVFTTAKSSYNCPHYQGKIANVKDYTDKVEEGFKYAYEFFLYNRKEILEDKSFFEVFKNCEFRLLARNSQVYGDILQHICSPSFLYDGAKFSSGVEGLCSAFLRHATLKRLPLLLYNGKSGLGLFFSALFYKTHIEKYRKLAKGCFQDFLAMINKDSLRGTLRHLSLGYASGICGCIHSLILSSHFLESPEIKNAAFEMASMITEESIEKDEVLDVISGACGSILTMLYCMEEFSDKSFIEIAKKCGEHLLKKRIIFKDKKLWPAHFATQPLAGFGHGSSGYAYALLKLYPKTSKKDFMEAAIIALSYENELYSIKNLNWPDFRKHSEKKNDVQFMGGWCSGAPGIGLSRLFGLDCLDNEQIRKDINNAIDFSINCPISYDMPDHICCGICSRIELLLEAGNRLNKPKLIEEAIHLSSIIIRRAKEKGHYTFSGDTSGAVFSPGLFSGTAGVGYTLLRLLDYKNIPSVLMPV